nr:hypothetical protein [Amycolatopsis anabasis]
MREADPEAERRHPGAVQTGEVLPLSRAFRGEPRAGGQDKPPTGQPTAGIGQIDAVRELQRPVLVGAGDRGQTQFRAGQQPARRDSHAATVAGESPYLSRR